MEGAAPVEVDQDEETGYQPPAVKSLDEIIQSDKDDEALERYKAKLLGDAAKEGIVVFPDDPRRVIVQKLALVVEGMPDKELDLTADLAEIKKKVIKRLKTSH